VGQRKAATEGLPNTMTRRSRRGGFGIHVLLGVVALCLVALLASAGCSSSSGSGSGCDSSKCASGNQCIDDGSGSGARCHLVCTQQAQCPYGYYCNDGQAAGQPANWCVQSTYPVPLLASGASPFGVPCPPTGGEIGNTACDTADGFACYGVSPGDASAFCTLYGCTQDTDCPGGWWCATVDQTPNVVTDVRTFGPTKTACLPRSYCSTCTMDHDCPATTSGTQQHCMQDKNGSGYCAPQCATDAACALDAHCTTTYDVCTPAQAGACKSDDDCPPANSTYQHCYNGACTPECGSAADCNSGQKCTAFSVCEPRAGLCVGDGGFCSPCHADSDCTKGGYCVYAAYSTERYCSVPVAKGICGTTPQIGAVYNAPLIGQCPGAPKGSPSAALGANNVGCTITTAVAPASECVAFTEFWNGDPAQPQAVSVPGCWTANRPPP
jgi:hypothetical protein